MRFSRTLTVAHAHAHAEGESGEVVIGRPWDPEILSHQTLPAYP